jgi:integral membrane protein
MKSALTRYRVMAYIVSIGLVILVCVGVPLRYGAGQSGVVAVVGPLHGVLYIVYLMTVLDLATRRRWPLLRIILVMAAGTIPFMGFVAEWWVIRHLDVAPAGRESGRLARVASWGTGWGSARRASSAAADSPQTERTGD